MYIFRSGAASSEIAALTQSSIASLSNQNVFALDQVTVDFELALAVLAT